MTYIINTSPVYGPDRYLRDGDTSLLLTYDPEKATEFQSRNDALLFLHQETDIEERHCTIIPKSPATKAFKHWISNGYLCGSRVRRDKARSRKYNGESKEVVLDWRIAHALNENGVRYEDYLTWPHLYECWTNLHSIGKRSDTDEVGITISVSKTDTFEVFEQEITYALQRIPYVNRDGKQELSIFDHFLSEGGNCVSLVVEGEGQFSICNGWGGTVMEKTTLKKAFNYLKEHRWYE